MKRLLEAKGRQVSLPRDVLKHAYAEGWLDDEVRWLQMLRDRNESSHVYNEETARRIYGHVRDNFPEMRKAYRAILDAVNG